MSGREHVDHCLNCGAATPSAYCAECGQEAIDAAVTFREQVAHFFEEVFTVEARLPQTLRLLLTRPGALTRAYNAGQRVRFMTPLKLYLFASVVFFIVLAFSGLGSNATVTFASGSSNQVHDGVSFGPAVAPTGHVTRDGPPSSGADSPPTWRTPEEFDAWLKVPKNAGRVPAFMQPHIRSLLQSPSGFFGSLLDMLSKATIALVPLHALLLKLFYWRSRRLYGEHIVFSLHLHAFAYLVFAVASLVGHLGSGIGAAASLGAILWSGGYAVAAARATYGEGVLRSIFKTAFVGVGYLLGLAGVLVAAAAAAFLMT